MVCVWERCDREWGPDQLCFTDSPASAWGNRFNALEEWVAPILLGSLSQQPDGTDVLSWESSSPIGDRRVKGASLKRVFPKWIPHPSVYLLWSPEVQAPQIVWLESRWSRKNQLEVLGKNHSSFVCIDVVQWGIRVLDTKQGPAGQFLCSSWECCSQIWVYKTAEQKDVGTIIWRATELWYDFLPSCIGGLGLVKDDCLPCGSGWASLVALLRFFLFHRIL